MGKVKKFIFGCILMVCGTIAGSGWLIATAIIHGAGSIPSVYELFQAESINLRADCYIIVIFYLISIIGGVFAIINMKENN